ncbi:hypothetical protein LINGRAHAP2_LOCUS11793 [Linum grandiflorum]
MTTAQIRAPIPSPPLPSNPNNPTPPECCMCGDFGFSSELFQCHVCQFRSQHRYCSNLYPKAESYKACNWCLLQRDDSKEKSQNSSNSSSSNHNKGKDQAGAKISSDNQNRRKVLDLGLMMKAKDRSSSQWQSIIDGPIKKKHKSPERSPVAATTPTTTTRRRLIKNGQLEEKLRRTKSDVMASNHNNNNKSSSGGNVNIGNEKRQVMFRSKVRRYKLLDEVSS